MKVLICGGRDYNNFASFTETLDRLHNRHNFQLVIHGAARGADSLADQWAKSRNIPVRTYPARWRSHSPDCSPACRGRDYCRSAGFRRNRQMLEESRPDLVIAFPGGPGTRDMIHRAKQAGLKVNTIT